MTAYKYTLVERHDLTPEEGAMCISCREPMLHVSFLDRFTAYHCKNPECVRLGLLSTAWISPDAPPPSPEPAQNPQGTEGGEK